MFLWQGGGGRGMWEGKFSATLHIGGEIISYLALGIPVLNNRFKT